MNNIIIEIQQNKTGDLVGLKHRCRDWGARGKCDFYESKKKRPRSIDGCLHFVSGPTVCSHEPAKISAEREALRMLVRMAQIRGEVQP